MPSLSPLDGRYAAKIAPLTPYFSEDGLFKYRVQVEVEWLIFLCNTVKLSGTKTLNAAQLSALRVLYTKFTQESVAAIKKFEATTKHDVKAVEYFLRGKLSKMPWMHPFIHFACTSEDINNLSYALMVKEAVLHCILPKARELHNHLLALVKAYADTPMLARTHGQPASPTTVGKELLVFVSRLDRQFAQIVAQPYFGKINGAVGNFNAHAVAYPKVNWVSMSKKFVQSLGLTWNPLTTQIEPHDFIAEICDNWRRVNTILIDCARDIWGYVSLGYFVQKTVKGEVGSSTMPHKVNPIDFENAEGNFGLANALFGHFSEKLPISRWQRDLTDSTVFRNLGVAFGYTFLALQSMMQGVLKLQLDEKRVVADLEAHPEVLAEAIQTVLRAHGVADAYEQLKSYTRGKPLTLEQMRSFVDGLKLPKDVKKQLRGLTPASYSGVAAELVTDYLKNIL